MTLSIRIALHKPSIEMVPGIIKLKYCHEYCDSITSLKQHEVRSIHFNDKSAVSVLLSFEYTREQLNKESRRKRNGKIPFLPFQVTFLFFPVAHQQSVGYNMFTQVYQELTKRVPGRKKESGRPKFKQCEELTKQTSLTKEYLCLSWTWNTA